MRNSDAQGRVMPQQFAIDCFDIRKSWPIAMIRETGIANDIVNLFLCSSLYFRVRGHVVQEKASCRNSLAWGVNFDTSSASKDQPCQKQLQQRTALSTGSYVPHGNKRLTSIGSP